MDINLFNWTYRVTSVFGVYVIFKFMQIFYKRDNVNKKIEFASYAMYYLITTGLYIMLKIPIVMMLANLILIFGLTWNYKARLWVRFVSTGLIYFTLFCVEMLIVVIGGFVDIPIMTESKFQSVLGLVLITLASYMVVLLMTNFKHVKEGIKLPVFYWFSIVVIPLSSLYLLLVIFSKDVGANQLIASMLIVFFVNFSVFYLYDSLSKVFSENADQRIIQEQNRYYEKQLAVMQSSLKSTRALRHDMNNHLSAISSLANKQATKEITDYVSEISRIRDSDGAFTSTGIVALDSVVNFKLQEAMQYGAVISTDISVPDQLQISAFDLTTILGNLLDNAITGIKTIQEGRKIGIQIRCSKEQLFINVKNTFNGNIKVRKGKLITTNKDKVNHGFGIENVKRSVEKYKGVFDYEVNDKEFIASVILYIES